MIGQQQETRHDLVWGWENRVENITGRPGGREVLILAAQGALRASLRSLLLAAPWLGTVAVAEDVPSVLPMVVLRRPALVIILDSLPGEVEAVLRWTRRKGSRCRSLVLVQDSAQRKEALELGADMALLRGFPAAELYQIIEQLVLDLDGPRVQDTDGE